MTPIQKPDTQFQPEKEKEKEKEAKSPHHYSASEVRDLEARLSAKKRGLATNAKMLEQRGASLPDGGAKLRLCIDNIKVCLHAVQGWAREWSLGCMNSAS